MKFLWFFLKNFLRDLCGLVMWLCLFFAGFIVGSIMLGTISYIVPGVVINMTIGGLLIYFIFSYYHKKYKESKKHGR